MVWKERGIENESTRNDTEKREVTNIQFSWEREKQKKVNVWESVRVWVCVWRREGGMHSTKLLPVEKQIYLKS